MNLTDFNGTFVVDRVYDCGKMVSDFASQVSTTTKAVSIAVFVLLIFEWWAVNKVMNGDLTHDKKQLYISFIYTFVHSLILMGAFILMYWLVISGLEF